MTTGEAMLAPIKAGQAGMRVLQVRGSGMMTCIPFQLQKKASGLFYPQAQSF